MIDDFAVWDRALSAGELATVYEFGLAGASVAQIPEPATMALLGCALAALAARRRRQ